MFLSNRFDTHGKSESIPLSKPQNEVAVPIQFTYFFCHSSKSSIEDSLQFYFYFFIFFARKEAKLFSACVKGETTTVKLPKLRRTTTAKMCISNQSTDNMFRIWRLVSLCFCDPCHWKTVSWNMYAENQTPGKKMLNITECSWKTEQRRCHIEWIAEES